MIKRYGQNKFVTKIKAKLAWWTPKFTRILMIFFVCVYFNIVECDKIVAVNPPELF